MIIKLCSEETNINRLYPDYNFKISTPDMFSYPEDTAGQREQNWHGSSVAWHCSLDSYVTPVENLSERFTGIKLKFDSHSLFVISVYFPTRGKDDEYLQCVTDLHNYILLNGDENELLIIGCDSNCSETSTKRRKTALVSLCDNLRLQKIACNVSTFHHNNGTSKANLDCFLISEHSLPPIKPSIECTLVNPLNLSAHDPVISSIQLSCNKTKISSINNYPVLR